VKPLEPSDSHHLRAAEGWLELGNHIEANAELELIAPILRAHPDVLEIRWAIYAIAEKWNECADIGRALVELEPEDAFGWIHRAYALRRAPGGGLQAAYDALLPAADRLNELETVFFNLACYACQLGDLKAAKQWLKKAFGTGNATKIKLMALDEPDLKPLWMEIAGL
jgi:hypothetical protein